jgi:transposase-like protein
MDAALRAGIERANSPTAEADQLSWRTDETYVRVAGALDLFYRAVASASTTIDFLLYETHCLNSSRGFFKKALAAPWHFCPRVINVVGNPFYPARGV